jgi:hypothetical protein
MAVSPAYCRSLLGQWVECHSAYGVHHGILHEVRPDGIVLAMPRGRMTGVVGESEDLKVNYTDHPLKPEYETVQFFRPFFNPFFFFLPFFLLFALRRRRRFI